MGDASRLYATIMEVAGAEVDSQIRLLAAFEENAAGSIAAGNATWEVDGFLGGGINPGAICDASLAGPGGGHAHCVPPGRRSRRARL